MENYENNENNEKKMRQLNNLENLVENHTRTERHLEQYSEIGDKENKENARKVQKVFGNSDSAELLMRIERLAMAHQDKDVDRMATCLSEFSEDEKKKIPDCIRARVVLCLSGAVNCWDINEIRKDCENYLDKYPDNYEIIKTYGDVLLAFGDELKAKEIYELVLKHSKNGMDLLEIRDRNVRS